MYKSTCRSEAGRDDCTSEVSLIYQVWMTWPLSLASSSKGIKHMPGEIGFRVLLPLNFVLWNARTCLVIEEVCSTDERLPIPFQDIFDSRENEAVRAIT
jgi:hypothetical protein